MGMSITEKILARGAGRRSVSAGQTVWVEVDLLMTHDVCGPGTIGIFEKQFGADAKVWDPDKVLIIPDHYIFTADAKCHRNIDLLRDFVRRQGLTRYYDPEFVHAGAGMPTPYADPTQTSYLGVCHAAMLAEGFDRPGQIILGTDSHTCTAGAVGAFATGIGNTDAGFVLGTGKLWLRVPEGMRFRFEGAMPDYLMAKDLILTAIADVGFDGATYRAMEFCGSTVEGLGVEERSVLCNMAIEAGGKNGVVAIDDQTVAYVQARTDAPFEILASDADAWYVYDQTFDTRRIEPVVARPHTPANKALAREVDEPIDRAYLGSCTGGKLTDMQAAARVLKGRSVAVETFVVPATTRVDAQLDRETVDGTSLRQIFLDAGCQVGPASCAACLGGPADTFGRANAAINVISATNRNFPGRMGSKDAGVYLASPLTVAASALTGRITDPRDVLQ